MWGLPYTTFILSVTTVVHTLDLGTDCTTPNLKKGVCVRIHACKPLLNALRYATKEIIAFAQQSQCGYDETPLVCCGTTIEEKSVNNSSTCGLEKDTERITDGTITNAEEFPWMAALEYGSKVTGVSEGIKCSGTLINERFVLTAAHCIINDLLEIQRVWLGDWRLSTDPDCQTLVSLTECADEVVKVPVIESVAHPDFSLSRGLNDIGLLRLSKSVEFSDYIRPICLPTTDLTDFLNARTVAGWGLTNNGTTSDIKLKAEVPLVDNAQCSKKLRITVTQNQLCAGGKDGKDACRGDSGGPLMRSYSTSADDSQFQWYLEGIVSWGVDCGRIGYPAIYTRVFKYINWINKIVNA